MKFPQLDKVASLLFKMAQEDPVECELLGLPPPGTVAEVALTDGIPIYTDKKLSVADYGPTLDQVLLATNRFQYNVTCDDKPLGYFILRPGEDHPTEYGTSLVPEIEKYRHSYPGEVRLCHCGPIAQVLWWPEAHRVVVLNGIGEAAKALEGKFLAEQEFHAFITGNNLALAVGWVLANENIDAALDVVIGVVDEWVTEGRFEAISHALRNAPETYMARVEDSAMDHEAPRSFKYVEDCTLALGWLTATYRAAAFLGPARIGYLRRVERHLRQTRPGEVEELLRGLG